MKMRITALVAGLFCASVLAFAQTASDFKGNWTMTPSNQAGFCYRVKVGNCSGGGSLWQ